MKLIEKGNKIATGFRFIDFILHKPIILVFLQVRMQFESKFVVSIVIHNLNLISFRRKLEILNNQSRYKASKSMFDRDTYFHPKILPRFQKSFYNTTSFF